MTANPNPLHKIPKSRKRKIKRYKSLEHKINSLIKNKKIKQKKVYPKEKCHFIKPDGTRCHKLAIGSGQLCSEHGGTPNRESLIKEESIEHTLMLSAGMLEANQLNKVRYDHKIHPIQMVKLSSEGLSEVEIAAKFGVSVRILQKWAETYEMFAEAYDVGMALHESWWLTKGKEGLDNPRDFNTSLYKFLTGNKLGYSDKVESKNFNVNAGVLVVPKTPDTVEEWEKN